MQTSVLNKQGNFGVKILWRYTDMAIFVLRCFILTHPVVRVGYIHRVRKKRSQQFSLHNFDKFRRSFVIFGKNHPEDSFY